MPLAWKVFRTKNTVSLSITTLYLTLTACLIWIAYATLMIINGYVIAHVDPLLASLPILISKIIMGGLMAYMIAIKLRNKNSDKIAIEKAKALAENPDNLQENIIAD